MLVMRPRDRGPEPVPVEARAYFSAAQIEKARGVPRRASCWIYVAQTAIGLGVLVLIVRRPPRRLADDPAPVARRRGGRRGDLRRHRRSRRCRCRAVARERAKDVGLVTQELGRLARATWPSRGRSAPVSPRSAAPCSCSACAASGARWWMPGAVVVVAFGAITTYAGPVRARPAVQHFKPLPRGELRTRRARAGRAQAGVDVGQVYEMDASRRTTAANAYVNGLGHDQAGRALRQPGNDFTPAETRLVVAHELGHVHHHDVRNGLIWLAIVAPFGMWAVAALAERLAPRGAALGPRAVPGRRALARDRRARRSRSSPTSSRATSSARADALLARAHATTRRR